MISEVTAKMTWVGVPQRFGEQGKKKLALSLKDMVGADNIEILKWENYKEEDENEGGERRK